MTVRELAELLADLDPDAEVLVSSDGAPSGGVSRIAAEDQGSEDNPWPGIVLYDW